MGRVRGQGLLLTIVRWQSTLNKEKRSLSRSPSKTLTRNGSMINNNVSVHTFCLHLLLQCQCVSLMPSLTSYYSGKIDYQDLDTEWKCDLHNNTYIMCMHSLLHWCLLRWGLPLITADMTPSLTSYSTSVSRSSVPWIGLAVYQTKEINRITVLSYRYASSSRRLLLGRP